MLTVIVAAMTHGLCDEAHASQHVVADSNCDQIGSNCPDCPTGDHDDTHCGDCTNCICHTFSLLGGFVLSYQPWSSDLLTFQPFRYLPEVYLSKFVPPQSIS
jgi:hypothetical protein